jgi:ABC-type dipeptide/oligopeptide/nickel transport system permease component
MLVEILPSSFRFNSKAGSWSLDPNILNIDDAITFLTAALYQNASHDPEATEDLKVIARRDLARAFSLQGDFVSAQKEYFHLLKLTPTDFGIAFHLRQVTAKVCLSLPFSALISFALLLIQYFFG